MLQHNTCRLLSMFYKALKHRASAGPQRAYSAWWGRGRAIGRTPSNSVVHEGDERFEREAHNQRSSTLEAKQEAEMVQGTPEWRERRRMLLTASDFGTAADFFGVESKQRLFEEKTWLREPFKGNQLTAHGKRYEDHAIQEIEQLANIQVTAGNFWSSTSPEWIGASPDGFVRDASGEEGVLEVKCPAKLNDSFEPELAKPVWSIPEYYVPQIMGQMAITGKGFCFLCSWTLNNGVSLFRVDFDANFWRLLLPALEEFWERVHWARLASSRGQDPQQYKCEKPFCAPSCLCCSLPSRKGGLFVRIVRRPRGECTNRHQLKDRARYIGKQGFTGKRFYTISEVEDVRGKLRDAGKDIP